METSRGPLVEDSSVTTFKNIIPIVTYHEIGDKKTSDFPSIYVSLKTFQRQIKWFKDCGFEFISLSQYCELFTDRQSKKKCVVLTFDDGYEGFYQNAFPVLQKYQCRATVFAIANKLNERTFTSFPYMNKTQIKEIASCGVEIGSHSVTHTDLTTLDATRQKIEILDSKKMIEDVIAKTVNHFCYPFGKFGAEIEDQVRKAGYLSACSTRFGRCNGLDDLLKLKRISLGNTHLRLRFWYNVSVRAWV